MTRADHPSRRPALAALLLPLLLAGIGAGAPLAAQESEPPRGEQDGEQVPLEAEEPGFAFGGEPTPESDLDAIDEILEGEIEVLGGAAHSYDPGDRRDPFKSLLGGTDTDLPRGPRPEGVPGLLIDEIRLSGIYSTAQGWVAQVQPAAREKGYLIKEGDQLYDGDVVSVTADEVVFRQIVRDPTALKPFREVTKRLNP